MLKAAKQKQDLITKVDEALQKKNDAAIENFEKNQVMRLKFLCPDAKEEDYPQMNTDEMHAADARKFKDEIKKQFLEYRGKFRKIMNEVRTTHYSDFAKLGIEKEKARVENQGEEKSGKNVYSKIDAEVKQLRERLKQAGVNRTVAGINAEEEYDSEEENED